LRSLDPPVAQILCRSLTVRGGEATQKMVLGSASHGCQEIKIEGLRVPAVHQIQGTPQTGHQVDRDAWPRWSVWLHPVVRARFDRHCGTIQVMTEHDYALPLADARAVQLPVAGGKGASLARLSAAGLPVPHAFVVTIAAYQRFVRENHLEPGIITALQPVDASRPATLDAASRSIGALFTGAPVPQLVADQIRSAYADLDGGQLRVAVRSSATAEDLPEMSFAGQQETYLNVRGEQELLDSVRRCWASLWTARAIGYRLKMGIDQGSVSMAVVVQRMVPSELSGVLFTANPTTGKRSEMVVNASYGLGEAVVSGEVTPDRLVVDKASLVVKEAVLGDKQVAVRPSEEQGTTTEAVPRDRRGKLALAEQTVRELGQLAVRVEKESGDVPQDLEWAVADGRCWLLQARPMTGLPPAPLEDIRWEPPIPATQWVRRQVAENMPEPLSPLFEELYLERGMQFAMDMAVDMAGESDLIVDTGLPWYTTVNGYAYLCATYVVNWPGLVRSVPALVTGKPIRRIFRYAIPYWRDEVLPAHLRTIAVWKELELGTASNERLLDGIRELTHSEAAYWGSTTLALAVAKNSDLALARFLSVAVPRSGLSSSVFLRGFPSKALEAEAELQGIAEQIRVSEELQEVVAATRAERLLDAFGASPGGREVVERLQRYLDRYGHQVYNLDFAEPTQAEDPLPVLLSLKIYVQQPRVDVRARQAEMAREREMLTMTTARSLDLLRRRLFLKILRWAQGLAPRREEAMFYVGSAWPALRRLALELGRRLVDAGSLSAPENIFYLKIAEVQAASQARAAGQPRPDLARLATDRHELREARRRLHPPAAVPPAARWRFGPLDISFAETQKRNSDGGATLSGFAVSPGRVTAPASVILSPADFDKMIPDTILVCPTTNPAWTPLFAQARGLVTDIGGVAAHGSIVAREYGIPAVMGTGSATQRILSGRMVMVDGDAGVVTLV
jgi:pyruvate,water dikinase